MYSADEGHGVGGISTTLWEVGDSETTDVTGSGFLVFWWIMFKFFGDFAGSMTVTSMEGRGR